ncbi:hypothetical protein OAT83_00430 [Gammaproteobacteria bacterium]|nr:hypothetical protein [Gammaproteobacteria bacterium]MDC1163994.1 hypothetical protein [Gammaproteobacteria bacterium]
MGNQNNQVEDLKNYEVKLKTTEKFNEYFKIRMAVETETFDPSNNYEDGCKLRFELANTLFKNMVLNARVDLYELFEIESVTPVQKKKFEVDVDLSTSVTVTVEAWNNSEAQTVAEELVECEKECYADVYDLVVCTTDIKECA